jgi:uncharacterized FlaG/YvyC family protein
MDKVSAINYSQLDLSGGNPRVTPPPTAVQPAAEAANMAGAAKQENNRNTPATESDLGNIIHSLQVGYNIKVELATDSAGKLFVRIMSSDGKRLLRQMPPDSLIKLHANIKNNRGVLADWLA